MSKAAQRFPEARTSGCAPMSLPCSRTATAPVWRCTFATLTILRGCTAMCTRWIGWAWAARRARPCVRSLCSSARRSRRERSLSRTRCSGASRFLWSRSSSGVPRSGWRKWT
eukprot:Amastigsp_a512810_35.p3 type:complete len:112 gc:universal Amastigsp_a512810_35:1020-685(-)